MQLSAGDSLSVYREPSHRSNGLIFDLEGRLTACEGNTEDGGRRISRTEKDGQVVTLADRYGGKRLNSPNDLVIDKEERIWFTDPRYGSYEGVEQDCEAVYRIEQDGSLTRVIESLSRPNGILFSLDYKTLYVADSPHDPNRKRALVSFEVNEDLTLSDGKILHDFGTGRGVDGMKLDSEENIWATAGRDEKAGVHIFSPRGELLTVIKTPDHPTNCSFAGPDLTLLYITGAEYLWRIQIKIPGRRLPG